VSDDLADRLRRFQTEHADEQPAEIPYCPGVSADRAERPAEEPEADKPRRAWNTPYQPDPHPLSPPPPPRIVLAAPEGPKPGEPEKKISLGDVAKGRKDYEREPKNWK
jgi:hypothetical protein